MHFFIIAFSLVVTPTKPEFQPAGNPIVEVRLSCKQASSCEEAVAMWCGGYSRADGDGDGIPCENVCRNTDQVEEIKSQQGC